MDKLKLKKKNIKLKEVLKLNPHLIPVNNLNEYIFHTTPKILEDKITKEGLLSFGQEDSGVNWVSDLNDLKGNVVFATNSYNYEDFFKSGYIDSIIKINTKNLNKNLFFKDPAFEFLGNENKHIIYFGDIPSSEIEIIFHGNDENTDDFSSKKIGEIALNINKIIKNTIE